MSSQHCRRLLNLLIEAYGSLISGEFRYTIQVNLIFILLLLLHKMSENVPLCLYCANKVTKNYSHFFSPVTHLCMIRLVVWKKPTIPCNL